VLYGTNTDGLKTPNERAIGDSTYVIIWKRSSGQGTEGKMLSATKSNVMVGEKLSNLKSSSYSQYSEKGE